MNRLFTLLFVILTLGTLAFPAIASAATFHDYVCADFTLATGVTCASNILTYNGAGGDAWGNIGTPYSMTAGTTYYVSFTYSGSGHITPYLSDDSGGHNSTLTDFTSSQTNFAISIAVASDPITLHLWSGHTSAFLNGTLSNICITDTIGGCASAPTVVISNTSNVIVWGDW